MKVYHYIFLIASIIVVQSCTTNRAIPAEVQYKNYAVSNQKQDSSFLMMISPYKDSIELKGLVPGNLTGRTSYQDTVLKVNEISIR